MRVADLVGGAQYENEVRKFIVDRSEWSRRMSKIQGDVEREAAIISREVSLGAHESAKPEEATQLKRTPPPAPASTPRPVELEALHPAILKAAGSLFATRHYSDAILAAFRAIEIRVREVSHLDGSGKDLMARAFGGDHPPIRIAAGQDRTSKDEQEGFRFLFMGAMSGIRNPKAHDNVQQTDPQRTLEYLAFASLLMRRLDDAAERRQN